MSKLHELLAVEATREAAATAIYNETLNTFTKKGEHFLGKHSAYISFEEQAEQEEPTTKEIVETVSGKLKHCFDVLATALDVTISKDVTNQLACSPIVIEGAAITEALPATSLLMLETRIKKWQELFKTIPTLAPARPWELDPTKGDGVYIDKAPEPRFRTKREIKHKVLVPATKEHRAEIEKWTEDVRIGKVVDTTWSAMMSVSDKAKLLARTQDLLVAVKEARQRANCQEVKQVNVAKNLINFLLEG